MTIFGSGVSAVYQVQTQFGTFPSSGSWRPLSAYDRSDGKTKPREIDPLLGRQGHNKRDPEASAPGLVQGGGQIIVPICLREFGYWLTATFGAPETEEATGVFTHVWESGKESPVYLAQSKRLKSDWYERTRGLFVNTMGINITKEAGYPRATLGTLLRDVAKATSEATGTIEDAFDLLRPAAARPFVSRNGGAAPTTAFTFNYGNQAERYDPLKPLGQESEYPDGYDLGDSQITGSFTVRLEDATFDDLAEADTKEPWAFGWRVNNGLGVGSHATLTCEIANASIDQSPKAVNTRGRLFHTYNWTAEQTADAPAVKWTLVNDVEGYPPPTP